MQECILPKSGFPLLMEEIVHYLLYMKPHEKRDVIHIIGAAGMLLTVRIEGWHEMTIPFIATDCGMKLSKYNTRIYKPPWLFLFSMVPYHFLRRREMVLCFRFLIFRLRVDSWWFEVIWVTRGAEDDSSW